LAGWDAVWSNSRRELATVAERSSREMPHAKARRTPRRSVCRTPESPLVVRDVGKWTGSGRMSCVRLSPYHPGNAVTTGSGFIPVPYPVDIDSLHAHPSPKAMNVFPDMDIRFPESDEPTLAEKMDSRATGIWRKSGSPVNRPVEDGQYFYHRDASGGIQACTVCLNRRAVGHLVVASIVPDKMGQIPLDHYVAVLQDFNSAIAEPAAVEIGGLTSIDTSKRTLEDYFSKESISLLEYFCKSSNGYGSHPSDQRKWRAFLLHVHRNENERTHGDTFGRLLTATDWFPQDGIRHLATEYNFAMELLDQADNSDES
jgi:hypothetical protein